jgi:hypothetical protein
MKPAPILLAAVGLLTGCPPAWQAARFSTEHELGDPPRVHAWAFADSAPDAELGLVRGELRLQLAAAGWLEAPVDQAELLVETTLSVGQPEWVDGTPPPIVALELASLVAALAAREEPPPPSEPDEVQVWPKELRVRLLRRGNWWLEYEGIATAVDGVSTPSTLDGALARELLATFPGPRQRRWRTELPPLPPDRAARGTAPSTATAAPGLPPRAACTDAVPVVAFRKARCWDRPDPRRGVAFRLEAATSGCARQAANGLVLVDLTDGRSGYVSTSSVRFHPGP